MRGDIAIHKYVLARIEEARMLAGFSKADMARRLNMNPVTYLDLQTGRSKFIDISLLIQIADVTGRNLSYFLPKEREGELTEEDAAKVIQEAFGLGTASVGEVLAFARLVADRDRRIRSAGTQPQGEVSKNHIPDIPESLASG